MDALFHFTSPPLPALYRPDKKNLHESEEHSVTYPIPMHTLLTVPDTLFMAH